MAALVMKQSLLRTSALTAGISLLIMAIAAAFSTGFVQGSLIVEGDAATTLSNIGSSNILFNAGIFGWLIILICDILVAWALYIYLKPMNKNLSLLGAWLRLIYSAILGIAILNLVLVSLLANGTAYLSTLFTIEHMQALVMLFLQAFDVIWSIGLILFGGHLMIVGYLAFQSKRIPKVISVLLLIASIGYIVNHLFISFLPQYDVIIQILDYIFIVPMIAGELGFALWLLFKGGKAPLKA